MSFNYKYTKLEGTIIRFVCLTTQFFNAFFVIWPVSFAPSNKQSTFLILSSSRNLRRSSFVMNLSPWNNYKSHTADNYMNIPRNILKISSNFYNVECQRISIYTFPPKIATYHKLHTKNRLIETGNRDIMSESLWGNIWFTASSTWQNSSWEHKHHKGSCYTLLLQEQSDFDISYDLWFQVIWQW